jgi:DNA-binding beta-propeller fold protein YncE
MKSTRWARLAAITAVFGVSFGLWNLPPNEAKDEPSQQAIDTPKFEVDPFWPKPLPDRWVIAGVGGTCIDAQDHLFIANEGNLHARKQEIATVPPPIIEFDPDGKVVNSWGNRDLLPGHPGWKGETASSLDLHGCLVDYQGNVWISGTHDGIVQKYSHDGSKMLLQIGTRGKFDTSDGTATGAPMNSSHVLLNGPTSIAVDPSNGDVYIADGYSSRRIVVFDRDGRFLRQWGQQGTLAQAEAGVGGVFLDILHSAVLGNDGLVYVCDRNADRVQVFDKMGNFRKNIYIKRGTGALKGPSGSAWWVAFSPDQAQKYMYVSDGGNDVVWILDHASGQILSSFGRTGYQVGGFMFVHQIAVDSKGNIIAGETVGGGRLQRFVLLGKQLPAKP